MKKKMKSGQHDNGGPTEIGLIAAYYDDSIEETLDEIVQDRDVAKMDPRDAMDWSEIVVAVNEYRESENRGRKLVALPPALHRRINEYAIRGMYKGSGRKRPAHSYLTTLNIEVLVDQANERRDELLKSG